MKPVGWPREPARHALAARGIPTKPKPNPQPKRASRSNRGKEVLVNFVRRNKRNFSSRPYLLKWSTAPRLHKEGFVLYVEAWNEPCLIGHATREQAFQACRFPGIYGNEIETMWFPPSPAATHGVSVSVFDLSTLPRKQQLHVVEKVRMEQRRNQ